MIQVVTESQVNDAAIRRSVCEDGASGIQQRPGYATLPGGVRHVIAERENRASPLLCERRRNVFFANDAHATEPFSQPARSGFALQAKSVAQLLGRNYTATDEQQSDREPIRLGFAGLKAGT